MRDGCRPNGFALVVTILLIVVGGVLAATVAFVLVSGSQSSALHLVGKESLMIAEAGLEHGTRQFGTGAAPCARAAPETQSFDDGAFTIADANTPATFNPLMNFDNVTPLPLGQCRIRSTGTLGDATRVVEVIVAGGGAAVAFDAAVAAQVANNAASLNWTHTLGAGASPVLIVGVSIGNNAAETVNQVTVNGAANVMTLVAQAFNAGNVRAYLYRYTGAALVVGPNAVQVNFSAGTRAVAGSASFTGVDQATPTEAPSVNTGTGIIPNVQVTTVTDNALVIDTLAVRRNSGAFTFRPQHWNGQSGGGPGTGVVGAGSRQGGPQSPPGNVNMAWLTANNAWAIAGAALRPAGGATRIAWREVFP